jgi:putative glutamine amidotransferase
MAQPTRPVIGINVDYFAGSKTQGAHLRLTSGYAEAVLAAGGMPVLMPPLGKDKEIQAFLDKVDGFILSHGLDLDPRRLGMQMHQAVRPMAERREENDRLLVRQLIQRQMPVLGIGVGMHQLNVACGGTLFLHLPEDLPKAMPHFDTSCGGPHRHAVQLQPNTRLDEIYGGGEIRVNSNHHQAVKAAGAQFRVSALAPDGVVEAIEAVDPNWFCVGVQWQPESETSSALDMQLFECFLQETVRAGIRQAAPLALAG